jgi:23S rRNA G2445 N2-methylase RlmL
MVIIAQKNAADAGVADEVSFHKSDFKSFSSSPL